MATSRIPAVDLGVPTVTCPLDADDTTADVDESGRQVEVGAV